MSDRATVPRGRHAPPLEVRLSVQRRRLLGAAATEVLQAMAAGTEAAGQDPLQRMRGGLRAFLEILAEHPSESQTLLVEIIGAGPRAAQRRDEVFARFAEAIDTENAAAARRGSVARLASPDDAYAIVGAVAELA